MPARKEATYRGARRNAARRGGYNRTVKGRIIKARETPGQFRQTYNNEPAPAKIKSEPLPKRRGPCKYEMTIVGDVHARLFRP